MSIYQGDTKISGNAMMVALPMFFATYQPRKLNNPPWLRADPYSWHSADLYVSAYAHLADNISGITAQTETIAGTTITFYKLSDEIKVVLPDQQTNLDTIYNATGIGYYFVLDTTNRQFKLPRNIYGFTGYRGDVGGYVAESLPNITGTVLAGNADTPSGLGESTITKGAFSKTSYGTGYILANSGGSTYTRNRIDFKASDSSSVYQNDTPVQQRATQAYLYFYVGNTVQNETSVDVAEMTEAINDKVDIDLGNLSNAGKALIGSLASPSDTVTELTVAASTFYTAFANGYVTVWTSIGSTLQIIVVKSTATDSNVENRVVEVCLNIGQPTSAQRTFIPIRKGQKFIIYGNSGATLRAFFTYAEGSEPQN